ncbi:MAG: ABC transporter permease [Chromatiales bacterium]|nr:MAG: ABC transporter permease [Chromatiales bacterium]
MRQWLTRHAQNCVASVGRLVAHPGGTLLTVAVIGVSLALPAGLNILVRNGEALAGGWESVRDFSVYLQPGAELANAQALVNELENVVDIQSVELVTADAALKELRDSGGFAGVLDGLEKNPLPHTLVVRPKAEVPAANLERLAAELGKRDIVDQVRLDTDWVARLNALLDLTRRGIWLAAGLLVGAVVVIVGNTIRLDIENQRAEIEVAKLLGATDAFVRRPFLYAGFWYGLVGGLFALAVVAGGLALLGGPVARLSMLYGGSFRLVGLDGTSSLAVVGGGLLAGLAGAWVAVARHLAAIQPKV